MLDTVLEIGKVLRAAPDGLKHHRYIKKAPVPDLKNNPVVFWTVPVNLDGSFDFTEKKLLLNENRQQQLLYLNYKQSDTDSTKPYVYGDIYRTITKTGEDGNFRFGDPLKKSWMALNSFQRADKLDPIPTERVKKFRSCFRDQMASIENFIREHRNVYLHFDIDGANWHELEEIDLLNRNLIETFFQKVPGGYVLSVFLFKTLTPGTNRTPGFQEGREFRNRVFRDEGEALDLLYGIDYSSRASVRKNDFKFIVLPRAVGLTAAQIERFFESRTGNEPDESNVISEELVNANLPPDAGSGGDELLAFLDDDQNIAQYDCIFSKAGGTKPDIDMIEIAGIDRSKLLHISRRLADVRNKISAERVAFYLNLYNAPPKKDPPRLSITNSFLKILGDPTRDKKKYQSHLFRVVPQIFNDVYYQDLVLLPAFIEKTEASIRNDESSYFNDAKFELAFLFAIQSSERNRLMETKGSDSYQVGLMLGKMAQSLRRKIKSFDKNYAGLLSRRITTRADVKALANEINQKLIMHEVLYPDVRDASQRLAKIIDFEGRYDKTECAFGFFESYFAPWVASEPNPDEDAGQLLAQN